MKKLIAEKLITAFAFAIFFLSLFSANAFAFALNAGCDSDVVNSGVDLITSQNYVGLNRVLITKGNKWWLYDTSPYDGGPAFIDGSDDLAAFLKDKSYANGVYTPDCFDNGSLEVNPGCDADVIASGIDTLFDHFLIDPVYQALITKENKWWAYDVRLNNWNGGYGSAGDDIDSLFKTHQPACMGGGSFELNPGCDADVIASGINVISPQNFVGIDEVMITKDVKWWVYDITAYGGSGGFVDGGDDLAAFLKDKAYYNGNYSPDCFDNGSLELNPGCDADVIASGVDTIANNFFDEPAYQTLVTKGTKWWVYDVRLNGGTGGYLTAGNNISAKFLEQPPGCNVSMCYSNADCGIDDYVGSYFCKGGDVYRDFVDYTCSNPGTPDAQCQSTISSVLVDDCTGDERCIAGQSTCLIDACSDGTLYGQCSATKPLYCKNGTLVSNCTLCGCPSEQTCQNNTCVSSDGSPPETTTTTTQPPAAPPTIEEEIEEEIEELSKTVGMMKGKIETALTELSDVLSDLELIKSNVTNPEHLSKIEAVEMSILETMRSLESFSYHTKGKNWIYYVRWFFGFEAEQEIREAEFFEIKSGELLNASNILKSVAEDVEDVNTRDVLIKEIARLRLQANELKRKAVQKMNNARGIISWIKNFIAWISKLFSRK